MELQGIQTGLGAWRAESVPEPGPDGLRPSGFLTSGRPLADDFSGILDNISEADLAKLLSLLEPVIPNDIEARLLDLQQETFSRIANGDSATALRNLEEIMKRDPRRLEFLRNEPMLPPVSPEADRLLRGMTEAAKAEAAVWLAKLDHFLAAGLVCSAPGWQMTSEDLAHLAQRLFESGGYANYLAATGVAQLLIQDNPLTTKYLASLRSSTARLSEIRINSNPGRVSRKLGELWRRAPLLVLLAAWAGLGILAGVLVVAFRDYGMENERWISTIYHMWGLGFLVVVSLGFIVRVWGAFGTFKGNLNTAL